MLIWWILGSITYLLSCGVVAGLMRRKLHQTVGIEILLWPVLMIVGFGIQLVTKDDKP